MTLAPSPRYPGPLTLDRAQSGLQVHRGDGAVFHREGLRGDAEYRDLGLSACTQGKVGIKHIRAIGDTFEPTGWHWHDMQAHFVYVLKGWIVFRFDGVEDEVRLEAGDSISQPCGVPHNVIARSSDLEVLELNLPAVYGTFDVGTESRSS